MGSTRELGQSNPEGARRFATTHWSVVISAGDSRSPESADALEKLCSAYWYPLYAFVRGTGHEPEEARDLTQEFFARLLEKKWLAAADPDRGRFRTFLLGALKHFLANEWHRARTQKRGGRQERIGLEELEAEIQFSRIPRDGSTPESLYDRLWATTLIARTQERLRDEMILAGEGEKFEALEPTLIGDRVIEGYAGLALRIGATETAVKSMVLRLRRRFRTLIRKEIAETVHEGVDVEAELIELLRALGG